MQSTRLSFSFSHLTASRGELATKVGYFGVKSTNVQRVQMGTKPAKLGRLQLLGVNSAKVRRLSATMNEYLPPPQVFAP